MSANATTAAPKRRKKAAQDKEHGGRAQAPALGHDSQNTSRPEGAKEGEWPAVPLGDIAEVKLGKMLDKAKHQTGRRLPYLRNVNVRWGSIETDDLLEMHFEDDELERFGLKSGDVLVCEGGEPGRAAVWSGHLPNLKFQKALHRVRFKVPFDARLLVYLLELLAKTGGLERRFTGSTIKHFTREAFVQLPIPFPPEKSSGGLWRRLKSNSLGWRRGWRRCGGCRPTSNATAPPSSKPPAKESLCRRRRN